MNSVGPISIIGTQGVGQGNSAGPILVIGKQRVGQANSVGPIISSRLDQNVPKGNREFAILSQ